MDWREHVVMDPAICHGRPTIKGTRVLVSVVLSYLANAQPIQSILDEFPSLSERDVWAIIAFAASSAMEDLPMPPPIAAAAGHQ